MSLSIERYTSKELVDILDECNGDLHAFAKEVAPRHSTEVVVMQAEFKLADNSKDYLRWCQLVQARNQARFKIAQQKAYKMIAEHEPQIDKMSHSEFVAFMRFWCSAESISQQTKARKEAQGGTTTAEAQELDDIYRDLVSG